jgi:ribosomal protein S18 acetylase RimI-like enzyme
MTEAQGFCISPLDPEKHDRAAFSCGVEAVDNFFKRTANKLSKADNLRVFVMTNDNGAIVGFYAINAHSIAFEDLPPQFARTRPGHGKIPAAYISMIGRDQSFAGLGVGADLLADCLTRILRISKDLGLAMAILDVLDDGDEKAVGKRKALYESFGFASMPTQPLRLYMPVATIAKLFGGQD